MLSSTLNPLVALLVSASGVLAATPSGFEPASQESLFVTYSNVAALDGAVIAKESTCQCLIRVVDGRMLMNTSSRADGTNDRIAEQT
jgi:hypothetical protein